MERKPDVFQFDDVRVDVSNAQVLKSGRPIAVEPKAFSVLTYLLENPGRLIEKEELLRVAWPNTFVTENALTRAIAQLRKALGDSTAEPKYIETVPTRGYRFVAGIAAESGDQAGIASSTATSPGTTTSAWQRKRAATTTVAVLALTLVVGFGINRWLLRRGGLKPENMEITKLTDSGKADNMAISTDGRYVAYIFRDADKQSLRVRQIPTRSDVQVLAPDIVDFPLPALTFSPDGNYIYFVRSDRKDSGVRSLYKMPLLGGPPQKLLGDIGSAVSFSPDGREFVFTRGISTRGVIELWIAKADGSDERLLATVAGVDVGFQDGTAWSPDGRTVAVTVRQSSSQRWVLDTVSVPDGSVRELYSHPLGPMGRPSWLPGGGTLLAVVGTPTPVQKRVVQIWAFSYPRGEVRRFTNDLTNYDYFVSLTGDGNTLAALKITVDAHIWTAPSSDSSAQRQLTFGEPALLETIYAGGQLVARSSPGQLWKIAPKDGERTLFAEVSNVYGVSPCGRFVVFNSAQADGIHLIRADADGSNVKELITTNTWMTPVCSPDGQFLFYTTLGPPTTIWRIPVRGGVPAKIAPTLGDYHGWNEGPLRRTSISPDGKLLAYAYEEQSPEPVTKLAVIGVKGGPPVRRLPVPIGIYGLSWSPDGGGLQYLLTRDGVTNIWEQPLAGGKAKQLTKFAAGQIWDFAWSPSNNELLLTRVVVSTDVILLNNFR